MFSIPMHIGVKKIWNQYTENFQSYVHLDQKRIGYKTLSLVGLCKCGVKH